MINIYTVHYIKPEFIELQVRLFKKFCLDDYCLNIINNGYLDMELKISEISKDLGVNCISLPEKSPHQFQSHSHAFALEHVIQNIIKKDNSSDVTVIIDSDVFPFKEFSFIEILNGKLIGGMYQQRDDYEYVSSIITIFKNDIDLKHFTIHGMADTGSGTNLLIKKYGCEFIKHTAAIDIESDYVFRDNKQLYPYDSKYRCQFIHDCFIHYYRGSNWAESDLNYHKTKYEFVKFFIDNYKLYYLNLDENVCYDKAQSNKGYNGSDHNYKNYKYINNK